MEPPAGPIHAAGGDLLYPTPDVANLMHESDKPAARRQRPASGKSVATHTRLPESMNGKASPAKAAVGDKPVFAYIAACRSRSAASPNTSTRSPHARCRDCSAA